MMAKMFYTLDEAKSALGRNEEEIKQLAREGRLREFRDGPRLMFKADQVEQLKSELGGGGGRDQIDLGPSDSGAPIGLVDSRSASGSGISLVDSEMGRSPGAGMQIKDDTALAADLGLSGSVGGMPSPGRPSGTGMSGSGLAGGSRAGVNVFAADDSVEHADPMAQTAISQGVTDQLNLDGVGSGSGLLDLTRESDDTSLGAELLDEIAPGKTRAGGPAAADTGVGTGLAGQADTRGARVGVIAVEARDTTASAFGGAALAASLFLLLGALVLTSAVVGTRPGLVQTLTEQNFIVVFGIGLGLALIFAIVGLLVGKSAR
ncbi:MAG TPA: hypothetical protein VGR35_22750 [Tepidisphaeraceae bacterium]|nr:hypothetical protein [Tepidisphaeraceae bacterium]